MQADARNVETVGIGSDQSYTWGTIENKFGKLRRYAEIEYHWHGEIWNRVVETMRRGKLKSSSLSFYKGAVIDEATKTVKVRGEFIRDYVADRHLAFWASFFRCEKNEYPKVICAGKKIAIPSVAGDEDSLRFFVNGNDVNAMLMLDDGH